MLFKYNVIVEVAFCGCRFFNSSSYFFMTLLLFSTLTGPENNLKPAGTLVLILVTSKVNGLTLPKDRINSTGSMMMISSPVGNSTEINHKVKLS